MHVSRRDRPIASDDLPHDLLRARPSQVHRAVPRVNDEHPNSRTAPSASNALRYPPLLPASAPRATTRSPRAAAMRPRPAFHHHALAATPKRPRRRPRAAPSCAQTRPARALHTVDTLRERAAGLKCPFWRRRFADVLDATRQVVVWALVSRHKSLPLPLPLVLPSASAAAAAPPKTPHLALQERVCLIADDFAKRQYYVTGRLSARIYADDCFFDGPDPDVPVTGLAKYTDAMGGLFDRRLSRVDLLGIQPVHEREIRAQWRLEGALNLPWKPRIKPYTGETVYTFDADGLVVSHVESWSISALDAFISVLFPAFGEPPAAPAEVLMRERESVAAQDVAGDGTVVIVRD